MNLILTFFIIFPSIISGSEFSGFGSSSMPPTILTLQMIIDYAVEVNWKQVVFFDCIGTNDCTRPYARPLMECFFKKKIHVLMKTLTETTDLPKTLSVGIYRIGVILFLDDIDLNSEDNLLRKIMIFNKNERSFILGEFVSWLLLSTKWNNTEIFNAVKYWPIGVDSDVTIAMSFLSADVVSAVNHQFFDKICESLQNYGLRYDYKRLSRSQSISSPETTFVQDTENTSHTIMVFYTVSVYKIRVDGNASLIKERWNTWSPSRKFTDKMFLHVHRNNLAGSIMNFGLHNGSKFYDEDEDFSIIRDESHIGGTDTLIELINLFERCLNVSANVTSYPYHDEKLKENNDIVHGIVNGEIDIGATFFDDELDRNKMLDFSYPIIHFTRNIYFKPPDSARNIFLQPFNSELLMYVLLTIIIIIAVMEMINYVTLSIHWKEDQEHFGLGEATLWCLSIMCMQGSPWTPRTRAGKAVLLASLIFALIIYNAYSGFITSILSVKVNTIKNISDFASFDYTFGCSKSDETYITMNEELRNFYVKALEKNQINMPEELGLKKAINGSYAFFISETVAKRILNKALAYQRCHISEFLTNTRGILALPISNNSPYKKIINVSILRMWQYGVLPKLVLQIKPPLLGCTGLLKFQEARLADVYGAFCILGFGVIIAFGVFLLERTWASRQRLQSIQRRITGTSRNSLQNKLNVSMTARLPMRILGIDREFGELRDQQLKSKKNTEEKKSNSIRSLFPRVDRIKRRKHVQEKVEYPSSPFSFYS